MAEAGTMENAVASDKLPENAGAKFGLLGRLVAKNYLIFFKVFPTALSIFFMREFLSDSISISS